MGMQRENNDRLKITAGTVDKTQRTLQKPINSVRLQNLNDINEKENTKHKDESKKLMMNAQMSDGSDDGYQLWISNTLENSKSVTAVREISVEGSDDVQNG